MAGQAVELEKDIPVFSPGDFSSGAGQYNYLSHLLVCIFCRQPCDPFLRIKDASGNITTRNYGLGFLAIIVALVVIGYLSSNFITSRIFSLFDGWLERTPGIKFIYSSVKDFFEAFAGNKRKFNKAVLVSIYNPDVFQVGFITGEDASQFGLSEDHVTVYIPYSYSFAGQTFIVPKNRVRMVEHVSASDAMKFVLSGGISEVDEDHHHPPHKR
jgi:uncharacterized membrane protein